jgi:hypothetical protein
MEQRSLAEVIGPWKESQFESGLIARVRACWTKPACELTNEELATCLRQKLAVDVLLPVAEKRIEDGYDDDTELYEGELLAAINDERKMA